MCNAAIVENRLHLWGAALLTVAVSLACAPQALARPGDLDPSYGTGGIATVTFSDDEIDWFKVTQADFQAGSKVIATGYFHDLSPTCGYTCGSVDTFHVSRLNKDGSLDTTFGDNGTVEGNFGIPGYVEFTDSLVDSSGRILIAGTTLSATVVIRLNPNGSIDGSFAADGVFSLPSPSGYLSFVPHLAQQSSGSTVVEWVSADNHFNRDRSINLFRLLPDGTQDMTFGAGGTTSSPTADSQSISSIEVDSGNNIVTGEGTSDLMARTTSTRVLRYLPGGTPDPGFGTGGLTTIESGPLEGSNQLEVAIDGSDRIDTMDSRGRITRLLGDGTPDPGFGSGGTASVEGVSAQSLGLQPDGSLLVGAGGNSTSGLSLARYLSDGNADAGFGAGGATQLYPSVVIGDPVILVQPDGHILLVAGGQGRNWIVSARFRVDSDPPDDADADRIPDAADPCPGRYGPGDGCPHYIRGIRLHRKGKSQFAGKVTGPGDFLCLGGSRIVLFRQAARGDRRLGSIRLPKYDLVDHATFQFVADRNIRVPVYAVTSQRFDATQGACDRVQSEPTRALGHRSPRVSGDGTWMP